MPARLRRLLAGLVAAVPLLLLGASPAFAATASDDGVLFGPELQWSSDGPDGYEGRLGETPSLYAIRISYPLDSDAVANLEAAATASATQGAVLVVSLEPSVALADLTDADAQAANDLLERLQNSYDTLSLVRFAPEMNGSWTDWGQQPTAYIAAFRQFADAVHAGESGAQVVWSPSYGAGYPFDTADGVLEDLDSRDQDALDTTDDGLVTEADDPYGPYWPGDSYVDRVGMSMFYFGKGEQTAAAGNAVPLDANSAPEASEVASRLAEEWGYVDPPEQSFYERFAEDRDLSMLLDTGALYDPEVAGDTELTVKEAWWSQLLEQLPQHPLIQAVSWLEFERVEAEAGDAEVDWRATADPDIAAALRADFDASGLIRWGPITDLVTPEDGSATTVQVRETGDEMGWIVGCAVALAIAFLVAGVTARIFPRWRYTEDPSSTRDLRLDLLRGFIIIVVVVTHIEVAGPYSYVSLKAIGAITGAELFVILSGVVLGMVFPLAIKRGGEWLAALHAWARARKQYIVALAVVLLVFALSLIPFVDATTVMTFTDRGTGEGGEADSGRVYDLYPNVDRLLDYPPPWYAVRQLLLLEMGPWPFNIMGLFVVLSLFVPPLMFLIRRRLWWLVLVISWGLYAVQYAFPDFAPLPSQFNAVFPLLIWQVLFTHGLVLGYYRRQIVGALSSRIGKIAAGAFVVLYAAALAYLWAGNHYGFEPVPFPADLYGRLYDAGYQRIDLQFGRLIDVVLVLIVAYAVLTVFWKPIERTTGWVWIPLGQASLYVFVVHVFFVLAVANIPGLDRTSFWQGTLIHTVVIAIILLMVRRRFLFSVIPR